MAATHPGRALAGAAVLAATAASAAPPPARELAYACGDAIRLVAADGPRDLPGSRAGDSAPRSSPDGRRTLLEGDAWASARWPDGSALAFVTDEPFAGTAAARADATWTAEIARIDADGRGYRRLTANRVWDGTPSVSPDGAAIAFETGRFGRDGIEVMDADGTHERRVTRATDGADWRPGAGDLTFRAPARFHPP